MCLWGKIGCGLSRVISRRLDWPQRDTCDAHCKDTITRAVNSSPRRICVPPTHKRKQTQDLKEQGKYICWYHNIHKTHIAYISWREPSEYILAPVFSIKWFVVYLLMKIEGHCISKCVGGTHCEKYKCVGGTQLENGKCVGGKKKMRLAESLWN